MSSSNKALKPLTKSRFKVGHECPRKLFYKNRPQEYQDSSIDDEFLKALAEGGFQVGALANLMYSPGHMIEKRGYSESLDETNSVLASGQDVTIFEAAIGDEKIFARVDILKKEGEAYNLIEVKAKSIDSRVGNSEFWTEGKSSRILSDWEPYLLDVAFQTWVARKHLKTRGGKAPIIRPYLLLVDKSTVATVDGLNQMFELVRDERGGCTSLPFKGIARESVGQSILALIDVSREVEHLLSNSYEGMSFEELVHDLLAISLYGVKPEAPCDRRCKGCEFRVRTSDASGQGLKNGFAECWSEKFSHLGDQMNAPLVFDLYENRNTDRQLGEGKVLISQLNEADLLNNKGKETSYTARQRVQLQTTNRSDRIAWIDKEYLKKARELEFPLHFIDFETCMTALPFKKGCRPYEQTVFQFSHHVIEANGTVRHGNEFLMTEPGRFPNFDFIRALRSALSDDGGTVLRYSPYENTVLNQVRRQLADVSMPDCPDKDELIAWIESLATPGRASETHWVPTRPFVDMMDWVENAFFYPSMGGSISIKKVLPALLEWSPILASKYSKPIYGRGCGAQGGIESKNFDPIAWVQRDANGSIIDPYKNLPPLFSDFSSQQEKLFQREVLNDGAAALTAYQRLQFSSMSQAERDAINSALLRYCELDTLAMVMIWQALEVDG